MKSHIRPLPSIWHPGGGFIDEEPHPRDIAAFIERRTNRRDPDRIVVCSETNPAGNIAVAYRPFAQVMWAHLWRGAA